MTLSSNNDILYSCFSWLPSSPPSTLLHTQAPKPLPWSPITNQSHVLHLIVIVCLCELFPLHNICKLYLRSWHCEEQKCRLQIIWAVNKEPALKCAVTCLQAAIFANCLLLSCSDVVWNAAAWRLEQNGISDTRSSTTCNFFVVWIVLFFPLS